VDGKDRKGNGAFRQTVDAAIRHNPKMMVSEASRELNPLTSLWLAIKKIEHGKVNGSWLSLRNALAVALPLGLGMLLGNSLAGVAVATGALNVSFSDGTDPYKQRARRMIGWSVLGASAVFLGSVTGVWHLPAILVAAAWAFAAGMLMCLGTRAGDLGLNTLVVLIVFAAHAETSLRGAIYAGLLVLAGGLLQTTFALLFWPLRRDRPERHVVGQVYLDLAREVDPLSDAPATSPLAAPSAAVQDTLAALSRDHSVESERYRLLFDQADRLRLSIYLLNRLRDSLGEGDNQRSEAEGDAAEQLDAMLPLVSKLLAAVGHWLIDGRAPENLESIRKELRTLADFAQAQKSSPAQRLWTNVASAIDVLAGQLRLVVQLAEKSTLDEENELTASGLAPPLKLQIASGLATLRANLDLDSAVCRHAIRLSLCIALGDAIERAVNWQRAYWLPMTIAVVLKPDFTSTFSRGVLRLLGTLCGLMLATVLYLELRPGPMGQVLLVGVFAFFLRYLGPANYGVFTVAISGLIVFLIAATGVSSPEQVVVARAVNTTAGGLLALLAYALWPTWERTQVAEAMAAMFDATRVYFQTVMQRLTTGDDSLTAALDNSRRAWRRTRTAAEASVDRVLMEPGITPGVRDCLSSMLASSHALVQAMMGLEAGAMKTSVHTSAGALNVFAKDVDFTLYFLSAALRGSQTASQSLPQLREDHRRLIESRASFSASDEYILIETDRLTVSLNTLREQAMRYVQGC
jgi:uncharacterized membrane protein YccC